MENVDNVKEKITNKTLGNFLISFNTDNLMENKDIAVLWLGKYLLRTWKRNEEVVKQKKAYIIYELRVNSQVRDKFYFDLLMADDFNISNFKLKDTKSIKEYLNNNKNKIRNVICSKGCEKIENYINGILK